ncbi:MAG: LysR family transcriptional regulator [Pseudomonadota bacterium]
MRYWLEMRTALTVAQLGTVSAAAKEIGVHRATINRHIETLEAAFQTKLFLKHARGYSLTDSGQEIIQVAARADEMFADIQARQRGSAKLVSGTLVVTAVAGVAATVMAAINSFREAHPEVKIEFIAESRLLRLEAGEAHIAFRGGPKPKEQDYVVQSYHAINFGLYASNSYVDRFGMPDVSALDGHRFVAPFPEAGYPPYQIWIAENVPEDCIVFRSGSRHVRDIAICHGVGIGFIDDHHASFLDNIVEILPPDPRFKIDLWVVTHVDIHRTAKVQAFLEYLRR